MNSPTIDLVARLRAIVGNTHVLTDTQRTRRYRKGFRFGEGGALAVVSPGSLVEQWRVLQACVTADVIIIMQAANTGLTGGSTPDSAGYDRPVVIVSTLRLRTIHVLGDDARQVVCLPGATLDALEHRLRPFGREPHSVIGSSCIGASVLGGVSNNSGGSLVKRGPVYTEMAIFARVDAQGHLSLVNHLGIALGDAPEDMLARLDGGTFSPGDIAWDTGRGHDDAYATHVRDIDADTPARFNADPGRLFEGSGCAGRIALFAVRLDSFPAEATPAVFYVGTNDTAVLTEIRRHILRDFPSLPIAAEYMHRDAFDMAERYGKDMFLIIRHLGTARMPRLFAIKGRVDAALENVPFLRKNLTDRLLQIASHCFPAHLPSRLRDFRKRFDHHLMIKVSADLIETTRAYLDHLLPESAGHGAFFACTPQEGTAAFLHRFATAGAAIRYRAIHPRDAEDIVALDIALRRNDTEWFERLPDNLDAEVTHKLYYGHFLCHVMHQDYVVRKGHDCMAIEHKMLALLDARGARYPAEHNVGHLYPATDALAAHYRELDPCNCFNPGIGHTPRKRNWTADSV